MKITAVLFFILQVDLLLVSSSMLSRSELKDNSISATEASQSKQQTVPLLMKGKQRSERTLFSRRVNDRQRLHATKPKALKTVTEPRKRSPPKNPKAGTESTKLSRSKAIPNPISPRCSARGDSCVPHGHSLCCGPCVSCHCRFFNAICYCRKTNSQCSKKG